MERNEFPVARLGAVAATMAVTLLAIFAMLGPAAAAAKPKAVKYEGKTSSGNPIRFTLKGGKLWNMESGIAVTCIAIQGSGEPKTGSDTFSYSGWVKLGKQEFSFMKEPAFYWKEATVNHTLTSKLNRKTGQITGSQREQYEFLMPTFPFPNIIIYSCLGEGTFKAHPVKEFKKEEE